MSYHVYVERRDGTEIHTPSVAIPSSLVHPASKYEPIRCETRESALAFLSVVREHLEIPSLTDGQRLVALKRNWRDLEIDSKVFAALNVEWIEEIVQSDSTFHVLYVA